MPKRDYLLAILIWPILLLGLISPVDSALALSEQELADGFSDRLHEFMDKDGEKSTFTTDDGVVIHNARFDQACNATAGGKSSSGICGGFFSIR